ncbi:hypothetical protein JTE90_003342 [Oedothorax gibbosus]|uniref:Uncharacterized protein n=1 Tax=Oedothorax gibbosus TaxID=931172 RepID=A0AAV6UFS2_9ARAC|nr:hypothetical protein JTE90_003342 [Oedothorax gibbosus]
MFHKHPSRKWNAAQGIPQTKKLTHRDVILIRELATAVGFGLQLMPDAAKLYFPRKPACDVRVTFNGIAKRPSEKDGLIHEDRIKKVGSW